MTWNEVIEALGQEPEELDFVQEHKRYPVTLQNQVLFLSKIAQKAYEDGKKEGHVKAKTIQSLEPYATILKIRAEIEGYKSTIDNAVSEDELKIEGMKEAYVDCLRVIDKYAAEMRQTNE